MGTSRQSETFKESVYCNLKCIVYILIYLKHITVATSSVLAFHILCTLFQTRLQHLLLQSAALSFLSTNH